MVRLFVALPLPPPLRDRLAAMNGGIPGARWVGANNLHLTLHFIGDIDEVRAQEVADALLAVRADAFDLAVSGFGVFSRARRPSSLWAGIESSDDLNHLHDKIETALVREGFPPEPHRFRPHVTVARLTRETNAAKVRTFIAGNNLFHAPFTAWRFVLFSSRRGHGEPVYTPEADYALNDPPPRRAG